jgi:16S rRNA (guanine527-N7)-methyltransferase
MNQADMNIIKGWQSKQGVAFEIGAIEKFEKLRDLVISWSKRINLVSKNDLDHLLKNHILDSVGPVNMISPGSSVIDIGAGAGFPGIPLAILMGDISVSLLESVHKKVLFLKEAKRELNLTNVTICENRIETLGVERAFDVATVRALPNLPSLVEKIQRLVRPGGLIIYYEKRGLYKGIHV